MLAKRNILISTLLALSLLTNSTTANGLKCSDGKCYIDVSKFAPSKNMPKKINTFKKLDKKLDSTIRVKNDTEFDIIFAKSYVKQDNEILTPLTEEEENTIIPAPEKFVATPKEKDSYYKQQRERGIELELIEPSLPMSLYYCLDNKEPIFDESARQFNCIVSNS